MHPASLKEMQGSVFSDTKKAQAPRGPAGSRRGRQWLGSNPIYFTPFQGSPFVWHTHLGQCSLRIRPDHTILRVG